MGARVDDSYHGSFAHNTSGMKLVNACVMMDRVVACRSIVSEGRRPENRIEVNPANLPCLGNIPQGLEGLGTLLIGLNAETGEEVCLKRAENLVACCRESGSNSIDVCGLHSLDSGKPMQGQR